MSSVVTYAIVAVAIVGLFYFLYQDQIKPIPDFDALQRIPADGMRYTLSKAPYGNQYEFEFKDKNGNRYQTNFMDADKAKAIEVTLHRAPVILSVGKWMSGVNSDSIFTVYHMTCGDRILINYDDIAALKKKEQQTAIPFLGTAFLFIAGLIVYLRRRQNLRSKCPIGEV